MYQEIFDGNLVKLSEESLAFTLVNWNGEFLYTYYLLYVILYRLIQHKRVCRMTNELTFENILSSTIAQ